MTTIILTGIQKPAGRKTEYLRVFGHDVNDTAARVVEVALPVKEVEDILQEMKRTRAFPEITIPDWGWCRVLNTGVIDILKIDPMGGLA
jgi:hypothetical protein